MISRRVVSKLPFNSLPFHVKHWKWIRLAIFLGLDAAVVATSFFGAFLLRFDELLFGGYWDMFVRLLPIVVAINLAVFGWMGMYRQVWRYATLGSGVLIFKVVFVASILSVSAAYLIGEMVPRSIFIIFGMLTSLFTAGFRFLWRTWCTLQTQVDSSARERCLIYGAGSGGDLLARHIAANPRFPYQVVGFIDDDPNKQRRMIHGFRILGTVDALESLCQEHSADAVLIAIPSAPGKMVRETFARCHSLGIKPLIMPDLTNVLEEDAFRPRPINVKDLLRRSPKAIDENKVRSVFKGKTILVTGAGGSIGSELCRQIVAYQPKCVVMLDASEFALYQIDTELRDLELTETELRPVLGSMVDERIIEGIFDRYSPAIVLHAAAYKHVPLVEDNPQEGVLNNVLGTKCLAETAIRFGVERFLLISSDKAVRPTSVMGATKRVCELLIQSLQQLYPSKTKFCAVRFGNVLGSSGSVVPRFLQQIQAGGPVTVTDPEITRFFMLVSEAVGLVLQSVAMSSGGEIFVLDMGEPVKIAEMAEQLIRLAGKEPGRDVEIAYTGLRPGEKLYEELILEGVEQRTVHDNIFVMRPRENSPRDTLRKILDLLAFARQPQAESQCVRFLHDLIEDAVPTNGSSEVRGSGSVKAAPIH